MTQSSLSHFENITDPRINRCKRYELMDILLLAVCAVIAGAEGWEGIEDFGHIKLDWLRKYRPFKQGIPRHDTIARVICRLNPNELENAFQSWISSLLSVTGCDVIAIDGKTARRSFQTRERSNPLHTVSAWSCQHQLVLGQVAVNQKSNEITAIPELLGLLDIDNSIITLDAMGCQKEIARQIVKSKADYILALKGNHSGLQGELDAWWHKSQREGVDASQYSEHTETDYGHGRIEIRHCEQMVVNPTWLAKDYRWAGLKTIIKVTSQVEDVVSGKKTQETRWYISSLGLDAKQVSQAVRNHWQVESMHWMLDMTFREDESRIRKGHGPLAFNVLRKIALNLFKRDDTIKASMARKRRMAGLDDEFRSVLLESMIKMR